MDPQLTEERRLAALLPPECVPPTDTQKWIDWLRHRALYAEAPAPSPKAYARLMQLLERLHRITTDQAISINGLQAFAAEKLKEHKKAVKQEKLL